MRATVFLCLLVNSSFSFPSDLQLSTIQSPILDINEAIKAAIQWHPSIETAANELKTQQRYIDVAKAAYYPQVNAGLRGGYDSSQEDNRSPPSAVLSVSQMLYDFGKTKSAIKAEQSSTFVYQAALLQTIDAVIQQTSAAVIEVQRFQQLVKVVEKMEQGIADLAELVNKRHLQGAGTRSDLVQSYSKLEAAKAKRLEYQTQLERWKSRLSILTGISFTEVALSDGNISNVQCHDISIEESLIPQLMQAKAQKERAEAQWHTAQAQQLPTLTLDPAVRHYLDDRPFNGGVMEDRTRYEVHLNFNMPLYQGGSLRARQHAAQHAVSAAEASIANAKMAIRQTLMESSSQQAFLVQHQQVLRYREMLSEETRDLYRQQYIDLGNRSLLDLLNAEQDIHQARIDQHNLLFDQQQLKLSCAVTGGILRKMFSLEAIQIHGVDVQP